MHSVRQGAISGYSASTVGNQTTHVDDGLSSQRTQAADRRGVEGACADDKSSGGDKLSTQRTYRRARGLCFKCGERWAPGHRCGPTVQLHVVEELLDMLQCRDQKVHPVVTEDSDEDSLTEDSDEDSLMSISELAISGAEGPHTIPLLGHIES